MNFVAIKTPEQSDLLSLHRVCSRLVRQRTAIPAPASSEAGNLGGATTPAAFWGTSVMVSRPAWGKMTPSQPGMSGFTAP
jgi:hypothetical protein